MTICQFKSIDLNNWLIREGYISYRRGLTSVAYPFGRAMREPKRWDKQLSRFPRSFLYKCNKYHVFTGQMRESMAYVRYSKWIYISANSLNNKWKSRTKLFHGLPANYHIAGQLYIRFTKRNLSIQTYFYEYQRC